MKIYKSKGLFILSTIFFLGTLVRLLFLSDNMSFIGDQGWFYLSARDMLLGPPIPLVGITSSHTWLHQGPYWTYLLGFIFLIFNFHPLAPAYFTAILGSLSVLFIYLLLKDYISKTAGIIGALLYLFSPLVVINDRFAYHTSPIPFLTIVFIYSVFKWVKGKVWFFPLSIFSLTLLYNFELFTVFLWAVLIIISIVGFYKKEKWTIKILNRKIIFVSALGFALIMLPIFIYDFKNGFPQTIIFTGWIFYKIFSFITNLFNFNFGNAANIISFLLENLKNLVFAYNDLLAGAIFTLSIGLLVFTVFKFKDVKDLFILFIILLGLSAIVINKTPSDAYLPVLFPPIIITVTIFLSFILTSSRIIGSLLIFFIIFSNLLFLVLNKFNFRNEDEFKKRLTAVEKIIEITKPQEYSLLGSGEGSQFESFTMNYEYLLWWKGHSPSDKSQKTKIVVSEEEGNIIINKYD